MQGFLTQSKHLKMQHSIMKKQNVRVECDPKYGCYPGTHRFHYDQVPLEFSQYGKRSYNKKGAGYCWIAQPKVEMGKRFATLNLVFRAEGPQTVPPGIIFRLMPDPDDVSVPVSSVIKAEMAQYDERVYVLFDPKAVANKEQCLHILDHIDDGTMLHGPVLLGLDNWGPQNNDDFHKKAGDLGMSLCYTPEACTDLVAVTDCGLGNEVKRRMTRLYRDDLESPGRLEKWKNGLISASERRILMTKWLGEAWHDFTTNHQSKITAAFKHCGMYNAIDGSENHLIKLRGLDNFKLSKPEHFEE